MDDLEFLDRELHKVSVFEDESKLSPEFVPENLLFRSDELRQLVSIFKSMFQNQRISKNVLIYGPVGTGKTSIAKKFGGWAQKKIHQDNNDLLYIHINCRSNKSPYNILLTIAKELNSHIPGRGYSSEELLAMIIELLEVRQLSLILVLDEVEYIKKDELSHLIYSLTRSSDDRSSVSFDLGLILIARGRTFLNLLDDSTKSTLAAVTIKLNSYSTEQLREIITERVHQSFKTGTVPSDTMLLAADIAGHRGDARYALELMWFAGKYTDQDGNSTVYPDYVRQAKSNLEPALNREVLINLSLHELLTTMAIASQLRVSNSAYLTTGTAENTYNMMCEQYDIQPRKHTQFWQFIKQLQHLNIIHAEMSGEGQRGRTQHITVKDVPAKILEEEVKNLLNQHQRD